MFPEVLKCSFKGLPSASQLWRVWPWFSRIQICLAGCSRFFTLLLCKVVSTVWWWCLSETQRHDALFPGRSRTNKEWLLSLSTRRGRREITVDKGFLAPTKWYTVCSYLVWELAGLSMDGEDTWTVMSHFSYMLSLGDVSKPPVFLYRQEQSIFPVCRGEQSIFPPSVFV